VKDGACGVCMRSDDVFHVFLLLLSCLLEVLLIA
jgi:hypothetical protein